MPPASKYWTCWPLSTGHTVKACLQLAPGCLLLQNAGSYLARALLRAREGTVPLLEHTLAHGSLGAALQALQSGWREEEQHMSAACMITEQQLSCGPPWGVVPMRLADVRAGGRARCLRRSRARQAHEMAAFGHLGAA